MTNEGQVDIIWLQMRHSEDTTSTVHYCNMRICVLQKCHCQKRKTKAGQVLQIKEAEKIPSLNETPGSYPRVGIMAITGSIDTTIG